MITNNSVFFETLLAAGLFCSPTGRFDDGLTYSNSDKKSHSKTQLTRRQKRKRAASKHARKARKRN